jgi:two-component system nitrogen regulation sensor histidine kinase GlnL
VLGPDHAILAANPAAEQLLGIGAGHLARKRLTEVIAPDSQLVALVEQVAQRGHTASEYAVVLSGPRIGEVTVDVQVAPLGDDAPAIVVCLAERSMAWKLDRQLTHRGAARTVAGMAAVIAHEIKNPLSGIRGAAQLLEQVVDAPEHELTRLICRETDRIRTLVERMDVFHDERPPERERVNIHTVLEHVRHLMASAAGPGVRFLERYDPSLPPVQGNRDQLIQVFLNLVKNALEAVPAEGGEITISTRYQHGLKFADAGAHTRHDLPILVSIEDNGPGIPEDLRNHLFDPFVTTKRDGTGLGLSLVAKVVGDHGGLVEVDTRKRRTAFNVRLPAAAGDGDDAHWVDG